MQHNLNDTRVFRFGRGQWERVLRRAYKVAAQMSDHHFNHVEMRTSCARIPAAMSHLLLEESDILTVEDTQGLLKRPIETKLPDMVGTPMTTTTQIDSLMFEENTTGLATSARDDRKLFCKHTILSM